MSETIYQFDPRVMALAEEFATDMQALFPEGLRGNPPGDWDHHQLRKRPDHADVSTGLNLLSDDELPGIATLAVVGAEAAVPRGDREPRGSTLALGGVTLVQIKSEGTARHRRVTITTDEKKVGGSAGPSNHVPVDLVGKTRTEVYEDRGRGSGVELTTVHEAAPRTYGTTSIEDVEDMFEQLRVALRLGAALEAAGVQKYLL